MKILLASHAFAPSIGGIETCSLDLAQAFLKLGHEVQVITQTPSKKSEDDHGLSVIRQPDRPALIRAMRWCDVYFQNNISLQTAWPLFYIRKPWVVCTATWLKNHDGSTGSGNRLKQLALRWATNIYISRAVRDHVGHPGNIIPNPYNSDVFRLLPDGIRGRSLVFLGRLVSDKGCDLLIQALARLREMDLAVSLTIIGTGSEELALKQQVASERLEALVRFVGAMRGEALARELNRHQVLVVPSRWEEPFGIVALEGIACGCLIVGSSGGGLPDAIGPCGKTFKNGDVADLTRAIREVLDQREEMLNGAAAIADHLNCHRIETVAARYIEVFEQACGKNRNLEN